MVAVKPFGTFGGKEVKQYTLTSANGVEVDLINWGVVVRDWRVPLGGNMRSVVLGFEKFDAIGMRREQGHALRFVVGTNAIHLRNIAIGERTVRHREKHHHRLLAAPFRSVVPRTGSVGQVKRKSPGALSAQTSRYQDQGPLHR